MRQRRADDGRFGADGVDGVVRVVVLVAQVAERLRRREDAAGDVDLSEVPVSSASRTASVGKRSTSLPLST